MDRYQALEVLMHAQLMELLAKDFIEETVRIEGDEPATNSKITVKAYRDTEYLFDLTVKDALIQQYENKPEFKMEQPQSAVLKPDTEKLAYMHNHGYTLEQIARMTYHEKSQAASELVKKLGKAVVWS